MKQSACHERGTKKKTESRTGFEPMTTRIFRIRTWSCTRNVVILHKCSFLIGFVSRI